MQKVKEKPGSRVLRAVFGVLRLAAAAVCANLIYTFIFTMNLNQINVGNITGCIFCGAVILLVCLYPVLRRRKSLRTAAWVCGGIMLLFAIYFAVISALIASEMRHGEDKAEAAAAMNEGTAQTVIVLGCKTLNGAPSPMLALRLEKALEYMSSHPDTVCVVTGGQGGDEIEPEAVTMKRYLLASGIPETRVYTDEVSANTTENIRNAAAIIREQGLPENVVVVSECYHIYRGVRQARLAGLSASGIYPDPASVLITMPSYWVREVYAVTRDIFFG